MRQQKFMELRFIPLQSPEIASRFPGLKEWDQLDLSEKLVVISNDGAVYQGQYAWIMCLYALSEYRESAQRLAHPMLLPFARRVCELISNNRLLISRFLKEPVEVLRKKLAAQRLLVCSEAGKPNF
jgi:hypothetical protein